MVWNDNKPWNRKNRPWRKWRKSVPRRRIPMRALSRTVARKRSEWGWLYNDLGTWDGEASYCGIRCVTFGEDCNDANPLRIPIVTPGALFAAFQDTVTIAKMRGRILWHPHWPVVSPCQFDGVGTINSNLQGFGYPLHLRAYLHKSNVPNANAGIPTPIDPMNAEDWTDRSGVLREWEHTWIPDSRIKEEWMTPNRIVGICSNTSRSAYTPAPVAGWVLATGSGNWPGYTFDPVPAITTTCTPVLPGEGCTINGVTYDNRVPPWKMMSLNRNRPIDLKEDDSLDIWVNWSQPRLYGAGECDVNPVDCPPQSLGNTPCSMQFAIQLKILYQYG